MTYGSYMKGKGGLGTTWDWVQTSRELECTEDPKSKQKIAESKSWKRKGVGYDMGLGTVKPRWTEFACTEDPKTKQKYIRQKVFSFPTRAPVLGS